MTEIPKKQLDRWNNLKKHGDGKRIAEANEGINDMDVSRAFKLGRCSEEVYNAIAAFYKEKLKVLWGSLCSEIQVVAGVKARKEFEEKNRKVMEKYFSIEEAQA